MAEDGQEFVVAHGDVVDVEISCFATLCNPLLLETRKMVNGGEERELQLELKILADVGFAGFPSVGKSTHSRVVTAASSKIGAFYHFTTIVPNLGWFKIVR